MKPRFSYVSYTRPKPAINMHALLRSPEYEKAYALNVEGCWIWQWQTNNGYPYVSEKGATAVVHRELGREKFNLRPKGEALIAGIVIRSCGKRLCVNPEHLEFRAEQPHHEVSSTQPLPEVSREEVRRRWRAGDSINSLARRFGVNKTEISKAIS